MLESYYKVGDQIIDKKTVAQFESIKTNKPLEFVYYDSVFSKLDWKQEPEPNVGLDEFYRRRAQQLRDKYDYLILAYSGGPDSQNILNTFITNDIWLDEIVNINSFDRTKVSQGTSHNLDYVANVKPYLEEKILKNNKKTRITIIDEIDMTQKVFRDTAAESDYYELLFGGGGTFASSWIYRPHWWTKHIPHVRSMVLDGKNIAVIYGINKPDFVVNQGKYSTRFCDFNGPDMMGYNDMFSQGKQMIELFYNSPEMPEILIKQVHLLKKFSVSTLAEQYIPEEISFDYRTGHRSAVCCKHKKFKGDLNYHDFHRIIYPGTLSNKIITHKTFYIGNRLEDCWWIKDLDPSETRVWRHSMSHHFKQFGSNMLHHKGQVGILPVTFSKQYDIE